MGSAICGGNHITIKTKKEWHKHLEEDLQNGFACLDCWCGDYPSFLKKKKKVK